MDSFAARLQLVVNNAARLRADGVTSLTIGDVSISLAPTEPAPLSVEAKSEPTNPADDPDTYGMTGKVPGFERPADLPRARR